MPDTKKFEALILARLEELGARMTEIDHELGAAKTADLEDQAIDLEDDEVLERLGAAAQKEVTLLRAALDRIRTGTYGICQVCENPISAERLQAVLYAALCKSCAARA